MNFKRPQSSEQSIRLTLSEITDKKSCSDLRMQWNTILCVGFSLLLFNYNGIMCDANNLQQKIIIVIMLDQPKWLFSDRQIKCIWCNLLRKTFGMEFRLMPWEWPKWIKYWNWNGKDQMHEMLTFFRFRSVCFLRFYCFEFRITCIVLGLALETHL